MGTGLKYTLLKSDLERAVVPEAPHTRRHGDGRNEEKRHEDQEPEVFPSLHTVTHQNLECQEEEVDPDRDQHGLEFDAGLALSPENRMQVDGK